MDLDLLIEQLQKIRDRVSGDAEVRVVSDDDIIDCSVSQVCCETNYEGHKYVTIVFKR